MFSQALTTIAASLPANVKYRLAGLRRPYTFVLKLGNPFVKVPSIAGSFSWEIDDLTNQQILKGTYESYMQEAFQRFVSQGSVVYDIGAHAGYHSLLCGRLTGQQGRVFAFEPHPLNCNSIERQLARNPGLNVTLIKYAVSDVCASVPLNTRAGRSQSNLDSAGDVVVEARTIDYLVSNELILAPTVIKIDVEGCESNVLRGALNTLAKYKPVILCDYNDGETLPSVERILTPLGYEVTGDDLVIGIAQL